MVRCARHEDRASDRAWRLTPKRLGPRALQLQNFRQCPLQKSMSAAWRNLKRHSEIPSPTSFRSGILNGLSEAESRNSCKSDWPGRHGCISPTFTTAASKNLGRQTPVEDDLRHILAFAADLEPDAHVLIHCWAGISRSTAVAYAILCQVAGPGRESECIEAILAVRPQAFPNALIVELADRILNRNGAMRQACEEAHFQSLPAISG